MIRTALLTGVMLLAGLALLPYLRMPALAAAAQAPLSLATSTDSALSSNWSGYVADSAQSYTSVGATWGVPAPQGASQTALATDATWVGIGGVKSDDLIQAGTQALIENGQVEYQAWYEALPRGQTLIPLTVHAGDSVSVSLTETSSDEWHLSFKDNTTGGDYEKDLSYRSSLSSAEWIEEMPVMEDGRRLSYLPLDNFGSVTFEGAYTVADGTGESLQDAGAKALSMAQGRQVLAAPTVLADDGSFSINRSSTPTSSQSQPQSSGNGYTSHARHGRGWQVTVVYFR